MPPTQGVKPHDGFCQLGDKIQFLDKSLTHMEVGMRYWILGFLWALGMGNAWGQNVKTYIPPQAFEYKATIGQELETYFTALPERNYVPALIEHESCISLKHSKCWNSASRLKTSREEGAGLGQLTRAWTADGTLRFDSLTDLRTRYKQDLAEARWETIYQRPDVQIRIIVLMLRDSWNRLYDVKDTMGRIAMMDAAYNGGLGNVNKERRVCGLTKGCDSGLWFGHVEKHCLRSKKPLYAGRSVCDIRTYHVSDVLKTRLPKYQKFYGL